MKELKLCKCGGIPKMVLIHPRWWRLWRDLTLKIQCQDCEKQTVPVNFRGIFRRSVNESVRAVAERGDIAIDAWNEAAGDVLQNII